MKKKILWLFCALSVSLSLFSCAETKEARRYDYDLSKYVELKNFDPVKAAFEDPSVCTEEEIDRAVFQIMLGYSTFTEKTGEVELYDRVLSTYDLYYKGEVLEDYAQSDYYILTGYEAGGDIDWLLGQAMIGKKAGEEVRIEYTFPKDDTSLGSWAGESVEAVAVIKQVYRSTPPECTDEFVQTIGDFGFGTVQDFRAQLKSDIMDQKEENKRQAVQQAFLDGIVVKKYPEAELKAYIDRFIEELKITAETMGVTYEEYLSDYLEMTDDEVSKAATEDSKERVKKDMACIYASRLMGLTITDEEYEAGLMRYYEAAGENYESVEAFEEGFTKEFMEESILWDKTFDYMVENAVNTEK